MTTNGSGLANHAASLAAAGLARVNVSVDTLDPDRYRELTRGGRIAAALEGIAAARAAGLTPIKLNSVLRRSSFRDDVPALLDLAAESGLELRFLELMRTGTGRAWCETEAIPAATVLDWLDAHPDCDLVHGHHLTQHGPEPARRGRLTWRGCELEVGWILPVSRPFCEPCDRLRLDPRGGVRRCLMDAVRLDLAAILEADGDEVARSSLADYLAGKRPPGSMDSPLPMVRLGG
jgi:cyclic pyranopterin phosphate synthase